MQGEVVVSLEIFHTLLLGVPACNKSRFTLRYFYVLVRYPDAQDK